MKHHIYFLTLLFLCQLGWAQDPIFTQYASHKLDVNPAFAGYLPGISINSIHRQQWMPVGGSDATFETTGFGLGMELARFQSGIGFTYNDHSEGGGPLDLHTVGFAYALRTRKCVNRMKDGFELSLGIKNTYSWRTINTDKLVFSDQLHPILGNIRATNVPLSGVATSNFSDWDMGILADYRKRDYVLRFGLAYKHIGGSNTSVLRMDDFLGSRYTIHGSFFRDDGLLGNRPLAIGMIGKIELQQASYLSVFDIFKHNFWYKNIDAGFVFRLGQQTSLLGTFMFHHSLFSDPDPDVPNTNLSGVSVTFGGDFQNSNGAAVWGLSGSYRLDLGGSLRSNSGGVLEVALNLYFPYAQVNTCNCSTPSKWEKVRNRWF